ncbi:MerR family transcriptional regulator [Aliagarivorans taiwanensis]|uniref:MerR family transcriptional regulator n=1 Tax=Aliagarivorans taiwanensis TaxID=561966 RepID=UPI00047B4C1D|nr:MerR family transcriptional regulator [Aliagarivorans taiwanensis]
MPCSYSIGQAAELTEVSVDTLRFYEKKGLMLKLKRASSGHRRYSQQDIEWLRFVLCLKSTGMPLEAIKRYRDLLEQGKESELERLQILQSHREQTQLQIQQLEANLAHVERKIAFYTEELGQQFVNTE